MKRVVTLCIIITSLLVTSLSSSIFAIALPERSFQIYLNGEKYAGTAFLEVKTYNQINSHPIYLDCNVGVCSNHYDQPNIVKLFLFDSAKWDEIEKIRSTLYSDYYVQAIPLADKVVELPVMPEVEDHWDDLYMTFDADTATFTRITPTAFTEITGREIVQRNDTDILGVERRPDSVIFVILNTVRLTIIATIFFAGWFTYKFISTRKPKQKRK